MILLWMNRLAAWLSTARVAVWVIIAGVALEAACVACPGIEAAVTNHLSFLAIYLSMVILVAGRLDTKAMHRKMDETIRAIPAADNAVIGIEKAPPQERQ